MTNDFVVTGPPGYLALTALVIGYFAILVLSQCAQNFLDMGPDCGPHFGHSGRSPASLEQDTLDFDKVIDLAYDYLHL